MRRQKGFLLLNIIFSLAIMGLLYYFFMKVYFNNPAGLDPATRNILHSQGIDMSNMADTVKQAQRAVDKANDLIKKRDQEAQSLLQLNN